MSFIADIDQVKHHHITSTVLAFVALVSPGLLMIFHYHAELWEKYDIVKLTVFALAITAPFWLANVALVGLCMETSKAKHVSATVITVLALIGTAIVLHSGLGAAFFFGITFKCLLWIVVVVELPVAGIYWWMLRIASEVAREKREGVQKP